MGRLGCVLETRGGVLGASLGRLGYYVRLRGVLGSLGGVRTRLGVVLGASWGALDVQGVVLETFRGVCWPEQQYYGLEQQTGEPEQQSSVLSADP